VFVCIHEYYYIGRGGWGEKGEEERQSREAGGRWQVEGSWGGGAINVTNFGAGCYFNRHII
jgi:hypothetical protein